MRAKAAGIRRAPGKLLIDGVLTIGPGSAPERRLETGHDGRQHRVVPVPGGWDITGPAGDRALVAAGPGAAPEPPAGTAPFDLALLDLLAWPAQLGLLRARGLIRQRTSVAALYTDHRIRSEHEMARRCALWGVSAGKDGQLLAGPAPASTGEPARPRPHRTLVLGGARSGKSSEAELRLAGEPSVTYLAAGPWPDDSWAGPDGKPDTEWATRVAAHRAARPAWWRTEESLDLAGALRRETGALLIDGIGTWLAAVMADAGAWKQLEARPADQTGQANPDSADPAGSPDPQSLISARIEELIEAWRQTSALVVAVTDEVGSGLVPAYPAGRIFRDQLGWLNQRLVTESDLNLLVVAGRAMTLPA
jgi:adenosylcobinamide kinase / adenosylcobinamide-phosphate guanylyltransferase